MFRVGYVKLWGGDSGPFSGVVGGISMNRVR
jgi:hypothetical protein